MIESFIDSVNSTHVNFLSKLESDAFVNLTNTGIHKQTGFNGSLLVLKTKSPIDDTEITYTRHPKSMLIKLYQLSCGYSFAYLFEIPARLNLTVFPNLFVADSLSKKRKVPDVMEITLSTPDIVVSTDGKSFVVLRNSVSIVNLGGT